MDSRPRYTAKELEQLRILFKQKKSDEQIAQDVANIEPEGEETDNTTDNDKQGI